MRAWTVITALLLCIPPPVDATEPAAADGARAQPDVSGRPSWVDWTAFSLSTGLTAASTLVLVFSRVEVGEIEGRRPTVHRAERLAVLWGRQEMAVAGIVVGAALTAVTAVIVFGHGGHDFVAPSAMVTEGGASLGLWGVF